MVSQENQPGDGGDEGSGIGRGASAADPTESAPNAAARLSAGRPSAEQAAPEANVWSGRTNWKYFSGSIIGWLLPSVGYCRLIAWLDTKFPQMPAFWIAVLPVLIGGLIVAGRIALRVLGARYRLTEERLFIERGILNQTIDQTELIRVDDVQVRKRFVDRIFGLGSVRLTSTDASDQTLAIEGIEGPELVADMIRTRMRALRSKRSLFVESL